ncbi:DUF262 domain-containing protein [Paenibacillus sp. chi10]|uniref:DUF262 domain-containing protein n=1 Tax=Paenibacillus suaedae TaxID=3077233 RepID=A0AAJ2N2F6_9BACL|nr:DUF262 domain-containing protein [Paenibacillus sp. chi10]MDT8975042.1 DUF262 domain-containing protein [Paenibacillus sp. chi10]
MNQAVNNNNKLGKQPHQNTERFFRKTRIEKSTRNYTIRSLYKEWRRDRTWISQNQQDEIVLRFDLAIQRNATWNDHQRSDLIHSLIYGYYIPPVLIQDSDDGKKWFLDGKQRITTIMSFIDGAWKLHKNTEDVYGHQIAGCKFKDLPQEMQDEILDESITIVKIENMTDEERDKMFVKQNSGTPLSRIELTRAKHSDLIKSINDLSNLHFFKEDVGLSKRARVRFVDQEMILQILMLFEDGIDKIKGFGAKNIEEYVLDLKKTEKVLDQNIVEKIQKISMYLTDAFASFDSNERKKALKKTHIPIIFWCAEAAMNQLLQPELYGEFIRSFLVTCYRVESEYGKSCQAGAPKKENVLKRITEMSVALERFISIVQSNLEVEEAIVQLDRSLRI